MLGVGWTEMLVIGVVALIVIGPKELPAVMQKLGKFAGTIRRMGSEFQRELNKTTGLDEIRSLRNSITTPLKATTDAIRKEFNTTTASGAVQPSGVLKPSDPKTESVVAEIHAAAGMKPPEPKPTAPPPAEATTKPPVKAAPRAKAPKVAAIPADKPVAVADIPAPAKPRAKKKPIESPAPVEAIAPAKPKPKTSAAKPKAAAKATEAAATPKKRAAKPATKA